MADTQTEVVEPQVVAPLPWYAVSGWGEQIVPVYEEMVRSAQDGAVFVEVGSWLGQSAVGMGQAIKAMQKDIRFYTVDHGFGSPTDTLLMQYLTQIGGCSTGYLCVNLDKAQVRDTVVPLATDSTLAAKLFPDNSVDFVYIDAEHSREALLRDLRLWWPKVKPGGIIGGHDYHGFPEIAAGVHWFFQQLNASWPNMYNSWQIRKPLVPPFVYPYSHKPIGIGVSTYNRKKLLIECVQRIRALVKVPYRLVVADDGSTDGTVAWCRKNKVPVVAGSHRGIAWNKNRLLNRLMQTDAEIFVLLEDDTHPTASDWLVPWLQATRVWGHMNYCRNSPDFGVYAGNGTPLDPFLCTIISAQCSTATRAAIEHVGYFDPRFRGYGFEHTEWSWRMGRAGFWGAKVRMALSYGLHEAECQTYYNQEQVVENKKLMDTIADEAVYRDPWHDGAEEKLFMREVAEVKV
jgi:hypothetical protein